MKVFSDAAQTAIEAGTALVAGAIEIIVDPPFRVFGGYGTVELGGNVFTGIGDRGLVNSSSGTLGGTADGITLTLSGVEPAVADLIDADAAQDAAVVLWRLIYDGAGMDLLDAQVFDRGRVDLLSVDEQAGGTATIVVAVETAARGLGRKGGRMRSDADQRLIAANDGGFRAVSFAGSKTLYWGGQKPSTAATALSAAYTAITNTPLGRVFWRS